MEEKMDFSNITLFNAMKAKLDYLSARQAVLAQNVANADTPDYRAKDIAAPDFRALAGSGSTGSRLTMTTTSPAHVATAAMAGQFSMETRKKTNELNPNGNNVSIEEEMMLMAGNQAEYQKAMNLYGKTVAMFKTALGRGPGAGG